MIWRGRTDWFLFRSQLPGPDDRIGSELASGSRRTVFSALASY